jgi:thioredoxin reductase (NADPH)
LVASSKWASEAAALECPAYISEPVLVAVEDDADALRDIERALRDRYARHYRVVCIRPDEAGARLQDLAAAGEEVALILAAQRLAGTSGSELLDEARHLHPQAKRGLLLAWSDWGDPGTGEAIFDSIVHGRIDHYLVRPSAAPDELFHQVISSMLLEWAEAQHTSPNTTYVIGESWTGRAFELRELLERCAIPHSFHLADSTDGRAFVAEAGEDSELPIVVLPDGKVLINPSNVELAKASGYRRGRAAMTQEVPAVVPN